MLNSSGRIGLSMDLEFLKDSIKYNDIIFNGALTKVSNAVLALFWVGEKALLGTFTVTLPDGSSSSLLGDRDRQMGQILGLHITKETGLMALVSVHIPVGLSQEAGRSLIVLIRNLLERLSKDD